MSRPIKFRGKNIHTGEWLYGDYHREGKTHYIAKSEQYLREYAPIEFIVDEKTVGQFTGMRDKNKKEIYEGDIVKIVCDLSINHTGVVIFHKGAFMVEYKFFGFDKLHPLHHVESDVQDMGATIHIDYDFKVVGNIYDNPKLLK